MVNEAITLSNVSKTNTLELGTLAEQRSLRPFADCVIDYFDDLSKTLLKSTKARQFPDVITFAFYCRKGNLLRLKKECSSAGELRLGLGLVFHIAPSNVPVNFAYSLLAGLLAGNPNIVRIPSKSFEQIQIISDAIDVLSVSESHCEVSRRIMLVRYDAQEDKITRHLSMICAARVIWGGDETIKTIRKHELSPRSFDITFADRYSLCVLDAQSIVATDNLRGIASDFYNDTYLFDQNACTAPHLVVWLGSTEDVAVAQELFWTALHTLVSDKYSLEAVQSVDKISTFYSQAIEMPDIALVERENNLLWRVQLASLQRGIETFRCGSGYFLEYHASSIDEVSSIVNPKYQTLSYYGVSKSDLVDFVTLNSPKGIDRVVPIGKTTDFSLNWDGRSLISSLSRVIEVS